jgi:plasmid stability protein
MKVEELTKESTETEVRDALKASIHSRIRVGMGIKQAADEAHRIANEKTGVRNG